MTTTYHSGEEMGKREIPCGEWHPQITWRVEITHEVRKYPEIRNYPEGRHYLEDKIIHRVEITRRGKITCKMETKENLEFLTASLSAVLVVNLSSSQSCMPFQKFLVNFVMY